MIFPGGYSIICPSNGFFMIASLYFGIIYSSAMKWLRGKFMSFSNQSWIFMDHPTIPKGLTFKKNLARKKHPTIPMPLPLEAAWLQSLRSWSQTCCPPDVTGGQQKWPPYLLEHEEIWQRDKNRPKPFVGGEKKCTSSLRLILEEKISGVFLKIWLLR